MSEIRFDFKGDEEAGSLRGIETSNGHFFFICFLVLSNMKNLSKLPMKLSVKFHIVSEACRILTGLRGICQWTKASFKMAQDKN